MPTSRSRLRILFSCVGRRVELVQAFARAGKALKLPLEIWGADVSKSAPAMHFCDRSSVVPPIDDSAYIPTLVELVRRRGIRMLVPLIDSDLLPLAKSKQRFADAGCTVLVSSPATVSTCRDKLVTYQHLSAAGIDTPRTWTLEEVLAAARRDFPFFVKPRRGSSGAGLHVIESDADLAQVRRWVDDPILQEYIRGPEFTLDAYTGFNGSPTCVVPRRRLRTRGGEVSESQVQIEPDLLELGRRVVGSLPGCMGVVTIQCIRRNGGRPAVIEINPRFGGGVPLSIQAGADMPRWILQELTGGKPRIPPTARRDGLLMTRYDQSVFNVAAKR